MKREDLIKKIREGLLDNMEGSPSKHMAAVDAVRSLLTDLEQPDERFVPTHAAVVRLLTALGVDKNDDNYKGTPRRVTEWLLEKFPVDDTAALKEITKAYFPTNYTGMIAQTGIEVYGLCPHHLKDVHYSVSIGYVPSGRAIGLSKLSRIAEFSLSRAGLQEDGTAKLAQTLSDVLDTDNIAVVAKAKHFCMVSRGVKQHSTDTTTSEMHGVFRRNDAEIKNEFLQLVYEGRK